MAIIDFFDRGWDQKPDGVAYRSVDESWTFQEAGELSCRIANRLLKDGVSSETKIAVLSPNDVTAWVAVLGLWRAGAIWVPLNPASPTKENLRLLQSFDCEVLFFHPSLADVVSEIERTTADTIQFVCIRDEATAVISAEQISSWLDAMPSTPPRVDYSMSAVMALAPTGGTTADPKGVMNTHRSFSTSVVQTMGALMYRNDVPIVNLAVAPMTHTAGMLSLPTSARGGTVVILPSPDPKAVLRAIEQYSVTEVFLPPTLIYRLLETSEINDTELGSLHYLLYGAAPMSVDKLRTALEVFGPILLEGYGQMEAPGSISFLRPEDHYIDGSIAPDSRLLSCGRPAPLVRLEVRDANDARLPAGEPGEICVRGDLIMKGYYKDPASTAAAIIDGWLHTGDIGFVDHEGYLTITDRMKDMIVSGGYNVFPSEVEQIVWSHPAVQDCAVIGVPHDDWGEMVVAVVELKASGTATADDLIALCKSQLGSIRAPKRIDFMESLPRTINGKVSKKVIRENYWRGQKRQI